MTMNNKPAILRKVSIVVAALVVVAGFAFGPTMLPGKPSKWNYERLKPGMTAIDVESLMGKPSNNVDGPGPHEFSYGWDTGRAGFDVTFRDDKLFEKSYHPYHTP